MSASDATQFPGANRILVVDDEEVVLAALRETLRLAGYEVVALDNPVTALRLLRETPFAVVLADQQMQALTGLELLAQAKELQPHASRILITAVLNLTTVLDSINKSEVYRFIVKPWLRDDLLAAIKSAVERYRSVCHQTAAQSEALALNQRLSEQIRQLQALIRQ